MFGTAAYSVWKVGSTLRISNNMAYKNRQQQIEYNMKFLYITLLLSIIITTSGCTSISKIFHNQNAIDKTTAKIDATLDQRLDEIGKLSYGVGIALIDNTNVVIAKELNDRVAAIANSPSLEDIKSMQLIVSDLMKNNQRLLDIEDNKIELLQKNIEHLNIKLNNQVSTQLKTAESNAVELNKMNKWWGLGAIWYGLTKIVTRLAWILGIGSVVFLIIRVFASTNPIAAAALSVFDHIGAFIMRGIAQIVPNAIAIIKKETEKL